MPSGWEKSSTSELERNSADKQLTANMYTKPHATDLGDEIFSERWIYVILLGFSVLILFTSVSLYDAASVGSRGARSDTCRRDLPHAAAAAAALS